MSFSNENRSEKLRKCSKCGKSPAADNVKLFRFPKPATRNLVRCSLWAKYLFPSNEQYSSVTFQSKLYKEHVMLCEKHFHKSAFRESTRKLLLFSAVPCDTDQGSIPVLPAYFEEPKPGTSQTVEEPIPVKTPAPAEQQVYGTSLSDKRKFQTETEQHLYNKCAKYMKNVCQLRNRIKSLKNKVVLNELTESNAVRKLSKKITPAFALLLLAQIRNCSKKSSGRRWSKEEKIVALRLFKRSPTCYRLLRRLLHLPSPGTLKALLNRVPFAVGVNMSVLKVVADFTKTQRPSDMPYILMFDEMSLRKHFPYNLKDDLIEGYQDHGTQGRSPNVASYALVFMIAGIRKNVKQPIAHYFSSAFSTADRLAVLIKDVLHQCFQAGINITATVCDMDGVNRRALSILGSTVDHPYFTLDRREIVTLFDTPHLLKCFRNLFLKYNIECDSNISSDEKAGRGVAKWSHLKDFFEIDNCNPMFVFAPALTKEHLEPNAKQKMRVKLAAQVLSHTVTAGLYAKISDGSLSANYTVTASVTSEMDKLFDCVNSDSVDLRRGKTHATNMTDKSPHKEHFDKMKKFFSTMKFIGCQRKPPSQDGWIMTLNAIERLFRNLKQAYNIKSLATRRLQQDPLENLFGCIRGNCGSNANPTTGQFVAGLKTAIISSLSHIGTTGNCEADNNVIINNFDKLLSASKSGPKEKTHTEKVAVEVSPTLIEENICNDSAEIQACAYVCGFLIKKLSTAICDECKKIFVATNVDKYHIFVECREYTQYKNSLNYTTKNVVACVESCALIIKAFLNEHGHNNIKKAIKEQIKTQIDFQFVKQCSMHGVENVEKIIDTVFIICVQRHCVVKNRMFADEASAAALKRKMKIVLHK